MPPIRTARSNYFSQDEIKPLFPLSPQRLQTAKPRKVLNKDLIFTNTKRPDSKHSSSKKIYEYRT